MKTKLYFYLFILLLIVGTSACATHVRVHPTHHKTKTIPPGQAKKITGSKSAKPFAPGQHKSPPVLIHEKKNHGKD